MSRDISRCLHGGLAGVFNKISGRSQRIFHFYYGPCDTYKSNGEITELLLVEVKSRRSLFGTATTGLQDYSSVAVSGVTGSRVRLQGGYALGLHAGNELAMFNEELDMICVAG
ncbi:MAG: hypothetical protein U0T56_00020 [Ferruginibacter sp.]